MKANTLAPDYKGFRSPPEIISHAVWLYFRFSLSFRDVEELLAQRGIVVTWQSCLETNFNAQRRLADWHLERAQTWEDLLAAHEKWLLDFNYQHHFAHEQREDGCHSSATVLGWVKGMQPEPERIYRAFSAVGETRTITKAGYVRFRDYLLYGEQNLAGERALVNLFQDILTLEYQEQPLARYSVEWQSDEKHLRRAGNLRLYDHLYRSAQLPLWPRCGSGVVPDSARCSLWPTPTASKESPGFPPNPTDV